MGQQRLRTIRITFIDTINHRDGGMLSFRLHQVCTFPMVLMGALFTFLFPSFAGEKAEGRTEHEVEAVILQVDSHGVYVPGKIFYWDEGQGRRSMERLREKAQNLRNRRATITYSIEEDSPEDGRPLLVTLEGSGDRALSRAAADYGPQGPKPWDSANRGGQYVVIGDTGAMGATGRGVTGDDAVVGSASQSSPLSGASSITREEVTGFIQNLLNLNNNKALDAIMEHYGDEVDHHTQGLMTRDEVRKDMIRFFDSWDRVFTGLQGEVAMIVTDERHVRIVRFLSRFHWRSSEKSVKGVAENIWTLRREANGLKLVGVRQDVLSREVLPP